MGYLKKTQSFILALMILISSGFFSFANENPEKITYEQAVELALKNNTEIRRSNLDIQKAQRESDDFQSNFSPEVINNLPGPNIYQINLQDESLRIQKRINDRKLEYIKSTLPIRIYAVFNDIEKSIQDRDILLEKREQMSASIKLQYARYENGLISKVDIDKEEKEFRKVQKQLDDLELKIQRNYNELKKIMEIGPTRNIEIAPMPLEYRPLKENEFLINHIAGRAIAVDINILAKELEKRIDSVNQNFYMFALTPVDRFDPFSDPYKIQEAERSIKGVEVEQMKINIRAAVNEKANTLQVIEKSIESTILQRNQLEKDREILEIQYNQGVVIKNVIDELDLAIRQLNVVINQQKRQYEFIKALYQNPYTAGN